jgi:magnesium and cobalt exporter, CNNM family
VTALALIAVLVLVLLNAFFVIAEYSLVRSRPSRLEEAAEEGQRGARTALHQIERIGEYVSVTQVGVTMTSIGIGALGEPVVGDLIDGVIKGPLGTGVSTVISVVIAYLIITSLHITLGEIVPKIYTIGHAEGSARRVARPLAAFRLAVRPFAWALNAASNWILRRLGVDPEHMGDEGGTPDELRRIIADSHSGGKLDAGEAGMLAGVFHLHEQEARQVMTPIPAVVTIDASETVEAGMRRCISSGHTRLVVTEDENQDRVKGILHANDLAQLMLSDGPGAVIEPIVHDAPIIPETKPLDDLLAELQRQRSSMAIVIDEYGRTAGLVTVEDIIEEVVGEIDDETDPAGGAVRRLANGDWFVRGHVAVTDLQDYGVELPVDSDAYNSVGGFVFAELGRLPKRGDTVSADGYSIRVESVRENRIEAVRIRDRRAAA